MKKEEILLRLDEAAAMFWRTRASQSAGQTQRGASDQGARSAVTGGAQMDGFVDLIADLILELGIEASSIFRNKNVELPGYFRPTKKWDLLVVKNDVLLCAIEVKSQVGPSFGNNFNNRVEEAIGSATDIWTAFREGAFGAGSKPWLGYLFLLEDCEASRKQTTVREPHFEVFPEFKSASYAERFEIFLRKLIFERLYDRTVLFTSSQNIASSKLLCEPAIDLGFAEFVKSLRSHLQGALE